MSTPSGSVASTYWRSNLRLVSICLLIWAGISYGFGIVLRPLLDHIDVGGAGLGFWFATQGAIYGFVALIFFYAWQMDRIDRKYNVDEK